jgi:hypothetical protein
MAGGSKNPNGPDRRPGSTLDHTEPTKKPFDPEILDKTVIAIPLLTGCGNRALAKADLA